MEASHLPGMPMGTRYVIENMTQNLLFPTSVPGSKKRTGLTLPKMNLMVSAGVVYMLGLRK